MRSPTREQREARPHAWDRKPYGAQCVSCSRVAGTEERKAAMDKAGCAGHAIAKLVLEDLGPYVVVNGHKLWQTGPFVWCARCGCHTQLKVRALAKQCRGAGHCVAGPGARRANLRAGRAPYAKAGDAQLGEPARLTLETWLRWTGFAAGDGEEAVSELNGLLAAHAVKCDDDPEGA